MSVARRGEAMLEIMSRYSQQPYKNRFRESYIEDNHFDHFDADDDWVVTQATAGTADVIDGAGGVLECDSNSGSINQGIQAQHKTETILPAADKHILWEARVKWADAVATLHTFVGLSVLDTTILASAANSSTDHIGVESFATATLSAVTEKGGVRGSDTSAGTMVEDTYIIVGGFVDGVTAYTPLINGVAQDPITSGSTTTPVTELAMTFACHSSGATDPILTVDWYYIIQVR